MIPDIKYVKNDGVNLAYQVFGSGSVDLIYVPGWISNIDWMWLCPELVSFFEELGTFVRVILFDKTGTGLSDRVEGSFILEERVEAINLIMDAVGSSKAFLFGHSDGGTVSALFSALYPCKVNGLLTFGAFAKRSNSTEYPWSFSEIEKQDLCRLIEEKWGSIATQLGTIAPSRSNDKHFMKWLNSYYRSGASPSTALKLTKFILDIDIVDVLKYINVPCLIMQRDNDYYVNLEEGKFIASKIKDAKFVEFAGEDSLFWIGNSVDILCEMNSFVNQVDSEPQSVFKEQLLFNLYGSLFDFLGTSYYCDLVQSVVKSCGGHIKEFNNKNFKAIFDSPSNAMRCGLTISKVFSELDLRIALGVSVDPVFFTSKFDPKKEGNLKRHIPKLILGQILVTHVVKKMLLGSDFNFFLMTSFFDQQSKIGYELYSVQYNGQSYYDGNNIGKSDDFLNQVLHLINENLDDCFFCVKRLSELMSVSERNLQRKIKKLTGKSPNQLIISMRLQEAKKCILESGENISEIAFKFGFSSPSYFSKCFKKEFGIAPTSVLNKKCTSLKK